MYQIIIQVIVPSLIARCGNGKFQDVYDLQAVHHYFCFNLRCQHFAVRLCPKMYQIILQVIILSLIARSGNGKFQDVYDFHVLLADPVQCHQSCQ